MIRRPPISTPLYSSAASDVYKRQVTPGTGPDANATSPGEGLLDHVRAHLEWFERLRERHPHVVFEACSSGAQRQDHAILSRFDLQSTSDQQDYRLYPCLLYTSDAADE